MILLQIVWIILSVLGNASCRLLQQQTPPIVEKSDQVTSLPGFGELGSTQLYSGKFNVSDEIFYLFAPAQVENPQHAPTFAWYQGGPGCSGEITFLNALGPLKLNRNSSLTENPLSWTKFANILSIDTPAPTGFSTPTATAANPSISNDTAVNALNIAVLQEFYKNFPGYTTSPLYLAGQSFGGHYIPYLASAILSANNSTTNTTKIPLSGILLGNPWTDPAIDNAAAAQYWRDSGTISNTTYSALLKNCNFTQGALWRTSGPSGLGASCDAIRDTAFSESGSNAGLFDQYAFNQLVCINGSAPISNLGYDPCTSTYTRTYLNRGDVQEALHAIPKGSQPVAWTSCVDKGVITYPSSDLGTSMLPVWRSLLEKTKGTNFSIVIFSGMQDGIVPTQGTQKWVLELGRKPTNDTVEVWVDGNGQVGGWAVPMEGGLSFVAVKDAGHRVPITTPARATQLAKAFATGGVVNGESLNAAGQGLVIPQQQDQQGNAATAQPVPKSNGLQHSDSVPTGLLVSLIFGMGMMYM